MSAKSLKFWGEWPAQWISTHVPLVWPRSSFCSCTCPLRWGEFVVSSHLAVRVFLRVFQFPSLHKNQHFQLICNSASLKVLIACSDPAITANSFKWLCMLVFLVITGL